MRGLTLGPDYTRARPGHRAVSISIDCVLVTLQMVLVRIKTKKHEHKVISFKECFQIFNYFRYKKILVDENI